MSGCRKSSRVRLSKAGRELVAAIERAGGIVQVTANHHLRVRGPAGVAFVSFAHGGDRDLRGLANTRTTLRRYAGIEV